MGVTCSSIMAKNVDLTIKFKLPKGHNAEHASITPEGELIIKDSDGNVIVPESMERTISYPREKKSPKIQSKSTVSQRYLSFSGVHELTEFDSVFVIDTNTKTVRENQISVACFACLSFKKEGSGIRVIHEEKLNYYEFVNIPIGVNPEKLAIYKVAKDVEFSINRRSPLNVVFITDSDIQSHEPINKREVAMFGDNFLPEGCKLHYASADTGSEWANKIIRFCDSQATQLLQSIERGELKSSEYQKFEELPPVTYRYHSRTGLEILNPVVKGFTIPSGQKMSLYGIKDENT